MSSPVSQGNSGIKHLLKKWSVARKIKHAVDRQRAMQWLGKGRLWIAPGAGSYLETIVNKDSVVVEYGAGSSTVWFARRCKKVYSFEANTDYLSYLLAYLSGKPQLAKKVRFFFVNCDWNIDDTGRRWFVKNGHEATPDPEKVEMERVCRVLVDEPIDLVLNDGSIRSLTLASAITMLKKNPNRAYLVVDNTERPFRDRYTRAMVPESWERIDFVNEGADQVEWLVPGSRCTVWIKPPDAGTSLS